MKHWRLDTDNQTLVLSSWPMARGIYIAARNILARSARTSSLLRSR